MNFRKRKVLNKTENAFNEKIYTAVTVRFWVLSRDWEPHQVCSEHALQSSNHFIAWMFCVAWKPGWYLQHSDIVAVQYHSGHLFNCHSAPPSHMFYRMNFFFRCSYSISHSVTIWILNIYLELDALCIRMRLLRICTLNGQFEFAAVLRTSQQHSMNIHIYCVFAFASALNRMANKIINLNL